MNIYNDDLSFTGEETAETAAPSLRQLQPQFKIAWLAALRSGLFHQGMGALEQVDEHMERRYCCLGVACVVLGVDPVDIKGNAKTAGPDWPIHEVWRQPSTFNVDEEFERDPDWIQSQLANMNDSGHSFAKIADWIEANL